MHVRWLGLGIILLFGLVRMVPEHHIAAELRNARFHGVTLNLNMRQQLGQVGFIAALGGFRAVVADYLYLDAYSAWRRLEWGRMKLLFDAITTLQPRCAFFWDMAAWHMAWNASVAAREDKNQPREALRIKAQREYWDLGEDFLLRGIQNNPDIALLYDRAGWFYRDKKQNPIKAFENYELGHKLPDALPYMRRFAVYELAKIPGREHEAYERAKALYNEGPDERLPTLVTTLKNLEEKLGVPQKERVYIEAPQPR